jgi:threonine/homoserine/homoserine lactone efflux protein
VIVCGALIGLYLLFIGVWALVKHGKRKNTSNNNNKGAQSTEQEQG